LPNVYLKQYQLVGGSWVEVRTITLFLNPEISRSVGTEWRVRHSGTKPWPRYRWRKRITDKVTLSGVCPAVDLPDGTAGATTLMKLAIPNYPTYPKTNPNWEGTMAVSIFNASEFGIESDELWVVEEPLEFEIREGGPYINVGGTLYTLGNYRLRLTKIGYR
jgi:hypothetical protein